MKGLLILIGLFVVCLCRAQISMEMEELIKKHEGLSLEVYMDGPCIAVGYGHHIRFTEMEEIRDLEPGMKITEELAELLFRYDMVHLVTPGLIKVKKDIGWNYPQNVYDVMGSIIYNIGLQGLKSSDFYQSFRNHDYEVSFTELLLLKSRDRGVRARRMKELSILLRNYDAERKVFNMVRH